MYASCAKTVCTDAVVTLWLRRKKEIEFEETDKANAVILPCQFPLGHSSPHPLLSRCPFFSHPFLCCPLVLSYPHPVLITELSSIRYQLPLLFLTKQ